jgi:hypothetical protein
MPPVENYLCDIRDSLTASRAGWAFPDRMQKGPALAGPFLIIGVVSNSLAHLGYICSLRPFLTLHDFEFDFITFGERFETATTDRAEVHEDVGSAFPRDEAKSFGVVKPFDRSSDSCH